MPLWLTREKRLCKQRGTTEGSGDTGVTNQIQNTTGTTEKLLLLCGAFGSGWLLSPRCDHDLSPELSLALREEPFEIMKQDHLPWSYLDGVASAGIHKSH